MDYERSITLDLPYADAVVKVKAALSEQGFGVLSEIDVQATLREKRGLEMEDYVILGACNPDLAHQALEVDRSIGVLLPCNVVGRRGLTPTAGRSGRLEATMRGERWIRARPMRAATRSSSSTTSRTGSTRLTATAP